MSIWQLNSSRATIDHHHCAYFWGSVSHNIFQQSTASTSHGGSDGSRAWLLCTRYFYLLLNKIAVIFSFNTGRNSNARVCGWPHNPKWLCFLSSFWQVRGERSLGDPFWTSCFVGLLFVCFPLIAKVFSCVFQKEQAKASLSLSEASESGRGAEVEPRGDGLGFSKDPGYALITKVIG